MNINEFKRWRLKTAEPRLQHSAVTAEGEKEYDA